MNIDDSTLMGLQVMITGVITIIDDIENMVESLQDKKSRTHAVDKQILIKVLHEIEELK